jgi:hydrogenase-4 component B
LIDPLSAFFTVVFALVGGIVAVFALDYVRAETPPAFFGFSGALLNLFFLSMVLVISAHDALFFLLLWELMTLLSWVFVMQNYQDSQCRKAGIIYLIMAHIGTVFLIVFFMRTSVHAGSTDIGLIMRSLGRFSSGTSNLLFFCILIGFGTKAGVFPLHIWLPRAHPAAPSHISALMSGVMIKTAFYGFLRFCYYPMTLSRSCGFVLLGIGITTAFIGILYAAFCDDIKKVLAFTSIENTGMMLLPLGLAFIFRDAGHEGLANLCVATLLLQTFNHGVFKSLLFMGSGLVVSVVHTRSLHQMGGLARVIPVAAVLFFCGSLAAAGLPPFNGFVGKWLIFQNLLYASRLPGVEIKVAVLLCAALLGLVGAVTAMVFVRLYTGIFSGLPRGGHKPVPQPAFFVRFAMAIAVLICFLVGLFPVLVLKPALLVVEFCSGSATAVLSVNYDLIGILPDFATLSPLFLLFFLIVLFVALNRFALSGQSRRTIPWACGITPEPEFEYSPSGYAQPFEVVFAKFGSGDSTYLLNSFRKKILPRLDYLSELASGLQSGNIRLYLFYILLTIILLLFWVHL